MALFNFHSKDKQYFALFSQMSSHIYDAAAALIEMLNNKNGNFVEHSNRIKVIELACDELTHAISTRLNKSTITPFEREDIYLLSSALDDIVDLIDSAARAFVMYDVQQITSYARRFANVILSMAVQLHEIVSTLSRPSGLGPRLAEIHRLEREADDIFHAAIHELFKNETDPLTVIKWKAIYEKLEAAVDRCENVSNIIEGVSIKHAG